MGAVPLSRAKFARHRSSYGILAMATYAWPFPLLRSSARNDNNRPLSLVIEPELHRHLIPGIIGGQGTKSVNALESPLRRLIERRDPARLFHPDVDRAPVARNIKPDINPPGVGNAGIDFVFEPVPGNFLLYYPHVPGIAVAKVASAASETEASLGRDRKSTCLNSSPLR